MSTKILSSKLRNCYKFIIFKKEIILLDCGVTFCGGFLPRKLFVIFGEPSPQGFVLGPEYGIQDFHLRPRACLVAILA